MALRHLACSMAACGLALAATAAQAAESTPTACMTDAEMKDLMLALAPAAFDAVRTKCGAALPAGSPLREHSAMMARYDAAAKTAWPRGKAAIQKLAPPYASPSEQKIIAALTPELMGAMVAPKIVTAISANGCTQIDQVATLLEPLPPENLGALVLMAARLGMKKHGEDKMGPIQLCPQ